MRTNEHRARQAALWRRRHPTDLAHAERARSGPLLTQPAERGHEPGVDLREFLNAIRRSAISSAPVVAGAGR